MEFRILGPLEALDDHGRPLALGGAKQRALLAVLLLHASQAVSADRLIDELWSEDPPDTARNVLQVYVANLRKVLEPARPRRAASSLLCSQPPGYLLDLGGHALDLADFERMAAEGRDALVAGDPQRAADALSEALLLWRGPILGDLAAELGSQGLLVRHEEQRLAALEQRVEADLALGRHTELVGELEALVTAHPLRERLRGQLMVALYRCGRQAEALDVYRQTRETLAEELGIDPSRALQGLERAILAQDPGLDWESPAPEIAGLRPEPPAKDKPAMEPPVQAQAAPTPNPPIDGETRRTVTVLSLGVSATRDSEDLDPEFWRPLAESYVTELRAVVEHHGGTVLELTEEAAAVVYGVPAAHENDALRAVRAAMEARDALAHTAAKVASTWGVDMAFSAAIQTGEVLVEVKEGQQLRVAGPPVRLARQLEQAAAPGEILLDARTCGLIRDAVRVEQTRPLVVRGRDEAIGAWRLVDVGPRSSGRVWRLDTPMVGRSRQLAQLMAAFEAAVADRACQLFTVLGPAGVGKSRLVHEFVRSVGDRATVRRGRCLDYGDGITFWALGEIVKAESGILESDGPAEAAAKLRHAVEAVESDPTERSWLQAGLAPLVGLGDAEQVGMAEQPEAFAAWRRFLEAIAARGPLVLVVEDLHWADEPLLSFLAYLVEWTVEVPLLVVCTARPELHERAPGWGSGLRNATTIGLAPLDEKDTARLVAALLGKSVMPTELQRLLVERAGGNPLYTEEYVRLLRDRGRLERRGGRLRFAEDAQAWMPETIQGIIAARLDNLLPAERVLLQDAAVVGQVSWLGALAALSSVAPSALEPRLHALERKDLLRREWHSTVAGERQYAFRHVLVRDVAYGQLPWAVRADRHWRAARWIQSLAPDRAEDRAELLAHHYRAALQFARAAGQEKAGLAEQARVAFREAGDRALALNAVATAVRWYTAALERWPADHAERPRLLLGLGKASFYAEATGAETLVEARDGLLGAGELELAAEAEALLGELAWRQGHQEHAFTHHRRAAELLHGQGSSAAKAFVLTGLAGLLWLTGYLEEAIRVGRQGLALAESLQLNDVRTRALEVIGGARLDGGDRGGLADLESAVAVGLQAKVAESVRACSNLAYVFFHFGQLDQAKELEAKAAWMAERLGLAAELRQLRLNRVWEDYLHGDWDTALRDAQQFIAELEGGLPEYYYMYALCYSLQGQIRLARGDLAGALQDADRVLELARAADDHQVLYPAMAFRARVLQATSRAKEANAQASALLKLMRERRIGWACDWWIDLAAVLQPLGRGGELVELATQVKLSTPWLEAATAFATGDLQRAADRYAKLSSVPDEAFARLRAAQHLHAAGRDTEASEQARRALAFYREVRASVYLREAEALLAASA